MSKTRYSSTSPQLFKRASTMRRVSGFLGLRSKDEMYQKGSANVESSPSSMLETSESSMDSSFLRQSYYNHRNSMNASNVRAQFGELSLLFQEDDETNNHNNKIRKSRRKRSSQSITSITLDNSSSHNMDDSCSSHYDKDSQNLVLSFKHNSSTMKPSNSRRRQSIVAGDATAPSKPRTNNSFKMEGVPVCVSQEIARKASEIRRRQQKVKRQSTAELQASLSSTHASRQMPRPKIHFLHLPKNHPFYWDQAQLSTTDFPEEKRLALIKILKHPQNSPSRRVEQCLSKLHRTDWDMSTLARSAMVLFHPDNTNPLQLEQVVAKYFYTRFHQWKTNLEQGNVVSYHGITYQVECDDLGQLYSHLRQDFVDALQNYDIHQNIFFW